MSDEELISKIKKLINKANASSFKEEADLFLAKASELMAIHDVTEAALATAESRQKTEITNIKIRFEKPYVKAQVAIAYGIVQSQDCQGVLINGGTTLHIFGPSERLHFIEEMVLGAKLHSATEMLRAERSTSSLYTNGDTKSFRNSFLLGYAQGIHNILSTARKQGVSEATQAMNVEESESVALVLVDEKVRINDAVGDIYPKLGKATRSVARRGDGFSAGRQAGASFSGHTNKLSGHRQLGY